ncbi:MULTISPECIES: hypothetical protein [unclassified Haloferax]|jgi:hypothetical protein|uniref:hypothetical protein n=1 Tax=unclassified Haloferax TaxID=2625095 RepID=UPI002875CE88|nr:MULTISPECIES: hypothetical protein [unclassified Haloferax]MDS0243078.1 hypothetical protein [Haloferax sp. S2CR25]MDS0446199.1 hypothetical protein [Haloferax sp. S2CR25-2]
MLEHLLGHLLFRRRALARLLSGAPTACLHKEERARARLSSAEVASVLATDRGEGVEPERVFVLAARDGPKPLLDSARDEP